MKKIYKPLAGFFGATLVALLFVPNSLAQCGSFHRSLSTHTSWYPQLEQGRLIRTVVGTPGDRDHDDGDASIVGFWHVKFVSDGVSTGIPGGVPKGAEVDAGYSQWHSDGTEIMNSGHFAPNQSNFCLGVWAGVGEHKYKLNHFATFWDPTKGAIGPAGPAGELVGPANIREEVILAPNGESFAGSFTIDNYDESNNLLSHIEGSVTGTRIKVDTPPTSIF
jgi:hypothetical protein